MLSLKNTSLVAFAAVVALPLIVFWAWPYSTAMDERLADAGERDLLIARSLSASLEFYHDELTAIFDDAVSDSDSPASFGDAQLASEAGFDYIAWVDETGRVLRKLGDHADLVPPVYDTVRLSALRAELKLGTPLGRVRASVSSRPELFFVRSRNNRLIVASVSTEHITNLAQRVNANREIVVSIVDAAGRVIASPLRHWELQAKDLSSLPVVRGLSMGIQGVSEADLAELGSSMIAAAVPVNGAGWGVIVSEPSAEVGVGDTQTSFAIAILVILVAALVGSLIAAPIVGPLMALSRAAQRMQKGETEVRIESLSWFAPTELIELRQAFNGMAESVAKARAEEAVARDTSDRANRSKTEFLRNVTHEIRTPLNAIIGFSEVLLNECRRMNLPQRQLGHAEDICAAGRHLLSLINSLLDLSRIEAGQYQLQDAPTAIEEVLARCVRFLDPAAQARKTKLSIALDGDLPDVLADERALFQIVLNLVSNAVRYGREGGSVEISAKRSRLHGLEITVADDGPGIPAEYLDKVMEPFVRVGGEANRNVEGSGLGLPIVKKLMELHGGSFILESTVGAGTTARLRLPADRLLPRADTELGQPSAAA
ncbi:MAG: sensor histidine kinase [Hyphomicrobiaceae bacterium]